MTDASKTRGLGFALLQPHDDIDRLVACGSRSLSSAEGNYATVELELLAVVYALKQLRIYVVGLENFEVLVDHKPLKGLFRKSLDEVDNPRLQRLLEKLRPYTFDVEWQAGKTHAIADALSRSPVSGPDWDEPEPPEIAAISVLSVMASERLASPVDSPPSIDKPVRVDRDIDAFCSAAKDDAMYRVLVDALAKGAKPPRKGSLLGQYSAVWNRLSLDNRRLVLLDASRLCAGLQRALHKEIGELS